MLSPGQFAIQDAGNGYSYAYKIDNNGDAGVNYFYQGQPTDRESFSSGSGQDAGSLENDAAAWVPDNLEQMNPDGTSAGPAAGGSVIYNDPFKATNPAPAGTTGGSTTTSADTAAYYQDQIDQINRLLGNSDTSLNQSLSTLENNYNNQNTDMDNQRTLAMQGYQDQTTQNAKDKQSGIGQVDEFANKSYSSLMRLLMGAGAGNSSVARSVIPSMVSRAGNTRRQEVFNTAGENQANIDKAQTGAENQFTNQKTALDEWKRQQEGSLRTNSAQQGLGLAQKLQDAIYNKSIATGGGYEAAKAAAGATTADINNRQSQLDALFGNFQPRFTPQAIDLSTPDMKKYQLDPGTISANTQGNTGGYYGSMLQKKKELTNG